MAFQLVSRPGERSMMLLTRPGRAAPSLIEAMAKLEDLGLTVSFHVRVDPGGTVRVADLTIYPAAPGEGAITSRALRGIRLDQLAKEAVRQQETPATMREDVAPGAFQIAGDTPDQAWVSPVPGRRRPTAELAARAARIYMAAEAKGSRAPTLAVAHELGYSRSQASRLIRAARDSGLLGQAPDTKPAQQPVVAAIVTSALGVLIGRRNDGRPPWTFIAGEQEPDELPEDTAVREVKEETGLEIRAGGMLGERVHPATGRTMIYLAAAPAEGTDIFVGDRAELAEVKWASLAEAAELLPGMFAPVLAHLTRELAPAGPHRGPGIFRDPAGPLPGTTREED